MKLSWLEPPSDWLQWALTRVGLEPELVRVETALLIHTACIGRVTFADPPSLLVAVG